MFTFCFYFLFLNKKVMDKIEFHIQGRGTGKTKKCVELLSSKDDKSLMVVLGQNHIDEIKKKYELKNTDNICTQKNFRNKIRELYSS